MFNNIGKTYPLSRKFKIFKIGGSTKFLQILKKIQAICIFILNLNKLMSQDQLILLPVKKQNGKMNVVYCGTVSCPFSPVETITENVLLTQQLPLKGINVSFLN